MLSLCEIFKSRLHHVVHLQHPFRQDPGLAYSSGQKASMLIHYTGQFKVKSMVQAHQFRKDHEDAHYATAQFRYQRELAVMFRQKS